MENLILLVLVVGAFIAGKLFRSGSSENELKITRELISLKQRLSHVEQQLRQNGKRHSARGADEVSDAQSTAQASKLTPDTHQSKYDDSVEQPNPSSQHKPNHQFERPFEPNAAGNVSDTNPWLEQDPPADQKSLDSARAEYRAALTKPSAFDHFIEWLKDDWLLKLGAFILLLGFAWLSSYAIANNWISPAARIALGVAAGAAIHVFGWFRARSHANQGAVFIGLGTSIVLVTMFIAQAWFKMFDSGVAVAIMFVAAAAAAYAGIHFKLRALSVFAVAMALAAPIMALTGSSNHTAWFIYLFGIALGSLWVVAATQWRSVLVTVIIGFALYSLPALLGKRALAESLIHWAYAICGLFVLFPTLMFLHKDNKLTRADLFIAVVNAVLLVFWTRAAFRPDTHVPLFVWSGILFASAYVIYRLRDAKEAALLQGAIGIYLVAVATGYALDGPALTIAYTIEAALIPLMTLILLKRPALASKSAFLMVGPALLSAKHIDSNAWYHNGAHHIWHGDFAALAVLAGVFTLMGLAFYRYAKDKGPNLPLTSKLLLAAALVTVLGILGLSLKTPQLTLALTACVIAVIVGYRAWLPHSTEQHYLYILMALPVLAAMDSLTRNWSNGLLSLHSLAVLGVAGACLFLARHSANGNAADGAVQLIRRALMLVVALFGAAWIWRATHSVIDKDDIATMVALTLYTLIGLLVYVLGRKKDDDVLVKTGAIVLGAVTARLMLIDIWDMAMAQRIITFLLVGGLFISTAFIGRKTKGT